MIILNYWKEHVSYSLYLPPHLETETEAPNYVFGRVNSILRCQTATDFFTKTSSKRFMSNQKRVGPYVLPEGYFGNFWHLKGHLAVSDVQMVWF